MKDTTNRKTTEDLRGHLDREHKGRLVHKVPMPSATLRARTYWLAYEAAAYTFLRSAYLRHEKLFYTPVDTTPSDSILSLVVRIKGQLCSRSHPNQSSSGPPKPFAAIPGSAALNNLP